MSDSLVVYFSRSGVTERLASQLAARLGADLELIKPGDSYQGLGGYLKGVWHALFRQMPIMTRGPDPTAYATVVIGSPVWVGHLSAPVRSYLAHFGGRGRLAAFWVSGGGAAYETIAAEIEQLTGCTLVATASFGEREVGTAKADTKLETMVEVLGTHPRKAG